MKANEVIYNTFTELVVSIPLLKTSTINSLPILMRPFALARGALKWEASYSEIPHICDDYNFFTCTHFTPRLSDHFSKYNRAPTSIIDNFEGGINELLPVQSLKEGVSAFENLDRKLQCRICINTPLRK